MMPYNPDIHHRRSIRLKGYNYSNQGAYFITICTHNRESSFGYIHDNKMILSEFGKIASTEWLNIADHYSYANVDIFQTMPNHIHGIIIIGSSYQHLYICTPTRATARVAPTPGHITDKEPSALTVGEMIGAYKSRVFKQCLRISNTLEESLGKLWQRNYYEHIIRNKNEFIQIVDYIYSNPRNWKDDDLYNG